MRATVPAALGAACWGGGRVGGCAVGSRLAAGAADWSAFLPSLHAPTVACNVTHSPTRSGPARTRTGAGSYALRQPPRPLLGSWKRKWQQRCSLSAVFCADRAPRRRNSRARRPTAGHAPTSRSADPRQQCQREACAMATGPFFGEVCASRLSKARRVAGRACLAPRGARETALAKVARPAPLSLTWRRPLPSSHRRASVRHRGHHGRRHGVACPRHGHRSRPPG